MFLHKGQIENVKGYLVGFITIELEKEEIREFVNKTWYVTYYAGVVQ